MDEKDLYDFILCQVQIDMTGTTPEDWIDLIHQFKDIGHDLNADARMFMKKIRGVPPTYDIEIDGKKHEFVRLLNFFKEYEVFPYLWYSAGLKDICMKRTLGGRERAVPFVSRAYKLYEFELGF